MSTITKALPDDAGCYVDGHWGQFGVSRVIGVAADFGFDDAGALDLASRHMATYGPHSAPELTDDELEALDYASDDAVQWLNDNVAPQSYYFGWFDGEFHLQSVDWWDEETF